MAPKSNLETCSCCGIFFVRNLCPQCYVAGCAHRGKGKPCRLSSDTQKTQMLPEFQVREAYAKLLEEHRVLTNEAQRLVRIIYSKDASLLEQAFGPGAVEVATSLGLALRNTKSNGTAEFPPQPPMKVIADPPRGEIQHG